MPWRRWTCARTVVRRRASACSRRRSKNPCSPARPPSSRPSGTGSKPCGNTTTRRPRRTSRALSALLPLAEAIDEQAFAKYRQFLKLLKDDLKWKPSRKDDRIVVFSERIATIEWLAARLREDLGLSEEQARTLHGSGEGADLKVQEIIADFGIEKKPIRILLASDLASEGLNLHYLSHKLIHFDIPWALLKFQQRNGRIDRYGQEREPHVWYLVGHPKQEKIRGDLRILERLIERDNAARENIGDPSVFMGTNIEERQEDVVAEAIESGESAEKFDADMDARARAADTSDEEQFAALEAFFGAAQPEVPASAAETAHGKPSDRVRDMLRLRLCRA